MPLFPSEDRQAGTELTGHQPLLTVFHHRQSSNCPSFLVRSWKSVPLLEVRLKFCRGAKAQLLQWVRHGIPGMPVPRSHASRCAACYRARDPCSSESASSAGQSCHSQEVQGQVEGCNGMHDSGTVRGDGVAWQTGHARLLTGLSGAAFPPTALSQLSQMFPRRDPQLPC